MFAAFSSLSLSKHTHGLTIWTTFAIMVYLAFVKTNAKLKVAAAAAYILGWVFYMLQPEPVTWTVATHLLVLVYCTVRTAVAWSTGDVG